MDELTRLREQLRKEKEQAATLSATLEAMPAILEASSAAALENKLSERTPAGSRISLFLEDSEVGDIDVDSPIDDVMATLAALSKASGAVKIAEEDGDMSTEAVTAAIPEDSKLLGRSLGKSVRSGMLNKNRAVAAARWVDKEIRKLIELIKKHGTFCEGKWTILFGDLFKVAEDVMEAVAGTLKTAKKQKVVTYEAELLMQGTGDNIVVILLKETIPDSSIDTYTYRQIRACSTRGKGPKKGKAFGTSTAQTGNAKCFICAKTVYAMEFVGASGKAFHKNCFRCKTCNGKLRTDNLATINDVFYCKTHYTEAFNKAGSFDFTTSPNKAPGETDNASSSSDQQPPPAVAPPPWSRAVEPSEPSEPAEPRGLLTRESSKESQGGSVASIASIEDLNVGSWKLPPTSPKSASASTGSPAAIQLRPAAANAAPEANRRSLSLNLREDITDVDVDDVDVDDDDDDGDMMAALGILDEMAEADAAINDVLTSMITISEEDEIAPTPGMDRRVSTQSTETADSEPDDDLEDGLKPAMMKRKIAASVRRGQVNKDTALVAVQWVDNEVRKLAKFIQDHGTATGPDGKMQIAFGMLDDNADEEFESLTGTLRTCKKNKVVSYSAPMLMRGVHNDVMITLLMGDATIPAPTLDTYSFKQIRQVSGKHFKRGVKATEPPVPVTPVKRDPSLESLGDPPMCDSPKTERKKWKISFSPFTNKKKKAEKKEKREEKKEAKRAKSAAVPRARSDSMVDADDKEAITDVMATLVVISSADGDGGESSDSEYEESTTNHDSSIPAFHHSNGTAAGNETISEESESDFVTLGALKVPEESKVLSRNLGASVRRGELRAERAVAAARWVDREIRKLIELVKKHGTKADDGKWSIKFGELFKVAEDVMEAVAGTLKTAKKHKVVAYEAELLMQGQSDDVIVNLLKEKIDDSNIDTYTYRQVRACSIRGPRKGKAFGTGTLQGANAKCFICTKTVYAMEFVGASGKAFHKNCFRCKTCSGKLKADSYCTSGNDVFYCKTHYTELFNKSGTFDFQSSPNKAPGEEASA